MAADADPTNPAAVWKRGSYNRVVWTRNNHEGGFVRWTIVPLERMWDKASHEKMAFDYGCWNVGRFHCNEFDFHRDCNYDQENEAFSKFLYIPPIYPDGDYVLGFTWYGGGENYGHFGDYYDCSYIRIEGGDRLEYSHQPTFSAGGGSKYNDGCESTVDSMGVCWKEPCIPIRKTQKLVPKTFRNGAKPKPVLSKWFQGKANKHKPTVSIKKLHLVDAKTDTVLKSDLGQIVYLHRDDEITLMAETTGDVAYVQWYTNGKQKGRDYGEPYTIAGDFRGDFYPWMHPLFNRRIRVAAKTVAKDGTYCWINVELRFAESGSGGVNEYHGTSWDEFIVAKEAPGPRTASGPANAKPMPAKSSPVPARKALPAQSAPHGGFSKRSARGDISPDDAMEDDTMMQPETEKIQHDDRETVTTMTDEATGEFA